MIGCKNDFALYLNSRITFHSAAMGGSSGAAWVLTVLKVSPETEAVTWHFLTTGIDFFHFSVYSFLFLSAFAW